ncbi:MAG: tannase/feruloyl esterase family alpha/beta hydrolase [Candidatus Andeanibacterium colombiense]|uniref:Tannase/feruloyl esterase family alpha/beta hydrolase n=1 Tax=Candidatus Andeanibacterium colombiense TaxID=3121345 RepID=A0AAJ5X5C4_9SPHN|nr:MAG: tannase/feruloyl esterase family alpha/beta hydrolase [Sphingomonadaceae bacterium]
MSGRSFAGAIAAVLLSSCTGAGAPDSASADVASGSAERCAALGERPPAGWPAAGARVASATWRDAGPAPAAPGPPGAAAAPAVLPAHCEIAGIMEERKGIDGQDYAIRFHLRLPDQWNGRFFMQGGGGTNGDVGDAIGQLQGGAQPALAQGYAVLSQDSGHDNALNSVPGRGGQTAFGFDPLARANYGGASLEKTALAAKAALRSYYGAPPRYSYFVGCSKGGQEGMALAQRYPELFDGIVAGAPGFSLPRAAIGETWNTQAFASVPQAEGKPVTIASLAASFSVSDFALVRSAVLEGCDADDGAADGIVGNFRQCTSAKVLPRLKARQCSGAKADGCLSAPQIGALEKVHQGPRDSSGKQIYPGFAWDAGWSDMGWRIWTLGTPDGGVPALNVAMGAPALATVFSSPASAPGAGLDDYLHYQLSYDFDRGAAAVTGTGGPFQRSAWADISARSDNLDAFRKRGGRMIVPQGVSDPVFSINDTLAWWDEVNARYSGRAADFTRVFPVPGMGHCQGGPATDRFDAFGALVHWVERAAAPDAIAATANPMSPWPGRARKLCPYPKVLRKTGDEKDGDAGFACVG